MSRVLRLAAAGLLAFGLAGCPPRYDFGPEAYQDPAALLAAVREVQARPDRVTGDARLRVRTPEQSFGADHFVAARRPGDLRLETLGFFGNPLALLLVHDGRLLLWDVHGGVAYVGPATADTLGAVAPVGLGPDAVVDVLLGTPPLAADAPVRLVLDHAARAYRLILGEGPERQEVLVDPEALTLRRVAWYRGGRLAGTLTYERYRRAGRGLFPYEQRYEAADGSSVSVTWGEVTLDGEVPGDLFQVELPAQVRVVPLEEGRPDAWLPPETPRSGGDAP